MLVIVLFFATPTVNPNTHTLHNWYRAPAKCPPPRSLTIIMTGLPLFTSQSMCVIAAMMLNVDGMVIGVGSRVYSIEKCGFVQPTGDPFNIRHINSPDPSILAPIIIPNENNRARVVHIYRQCNMMAISRSSTPHTAQPILRINCGYPVIFTSSGRVRMNRVQFYIGRLVGGCWVDESPIVGSWR